jgi:tetratricopeptide (TPR) repeat protein
MSSALHILLQAREHQQKGNLIEAEYLCRQALASELATLERVEAWHQMGLVQWKQGKMAEAIVSYQNAVAIDPNFSTGLHNLGFILMEQDKAEEAVGYYRRSLALTPDFAMGHNNLGNALRRLGQVEEAMACYREALRLMPNLAEAHTNLGNALSGLGRKEEALACFRTALEHNPRYGLAHNSLGNLLAQRGKNREADACYRQAIQCEPENPDPYYNIGLLLANHGRNEEAIPYYRQALRLKPGFADAHNNLGNVLKDLGLQEEAAACYAQALRINANHLGALVNTGLILHAQGKLAESLDTYARALKLDPRCPGAHSNRALVLLLQGDLEQGWPEYEWRWQTPEVGKAPIEQPIWDGSPLEGKTILLHTEQGLGDALQFCRYVPRVKEMGGTVVLACQQILVPLLASLAGVDRLVKKEGPTPPYDTHAPLLSLPLIFKTRLDNIPAPVPYLRAGEQRVQDWGRRLAELPALSSRRERTTDGTDDTDGGHESGHSPLTTHNSPPFKIGIAWQGNPLNKRDRYRSFPLAQFEPLGRLEGVRLISLQKGPGADQVSALAGRFDVIDLGDDVDRDAAFVDTAAIMAHLDLVVAGDSAVAHLAGALGVRVWVPLCHVADWRWLLEREDCPWYPTMRLFRQERPGDWTEVFQRIATAVEHLQTGR